MPVKPKGFASVPRKSHASTPTSEAESLADRLSFADAPRPFKNPRGFVSKLPYRTASTTTTTVRKTSKQISVLERERVGGGDGFLPANLTLARARGEVIEPGGKKKKVLGVGGVPNKRGYNLKNRKSLNASGVSTPATEGMESGQSTPMVDEEEEDEADVEMVDALPPGREVFTYHTPTAPPSLLPNKKYCDITGLHASYTDPRTKLRYKGLDVWHVVRGLGPGGDQAYLALRGAQTSLK